MGSDAVEIARRYVDLSNRHDVEAIGGLLADDAVYRSGRVGSYRGRDDILGMMRRFFRHYPDVRWEVEEYSLDPDGAVRFAYRISGGATTGETLNGGGAETIRLSKEGRIVEIEVSAAD
jgi:ketosteroid isomerase-like protein